MSSLGRKNTNISVTGSGTKGGVSSQRPVATGDGGQRSSPIADLDAATTQHMLAVVEPCRSNLAETRGLRLALFGRASAIARHDPRHMHRSRAEAHKVDPPCLWLCGVQLVVCHVMLGKEDALIHFQTTVTPFHVQAHGMHTQHAWRGHGAQAHTHNRPCRLPGAHRTANAARHASGGQKARHEQHAQPANRGQCM